MPDSDTLSLSQKQRRFTHLVGQFLCWAFAQGYELVLLEAARTPEQQQLYVQQGKSQSLESAHLKRLAVDVALFVNGVYHQSTAAYEPLGAYWEGLDPANIWGGRWTRFPDGNHFEYI